MEGLKEVIFFTKNRNLKKTFLWGGGGGRELEARVSFFLLSIHI